MFLTTSFVTACLVTDAGLAALIVFLAWSLDRANNAAARDHLAHADRFDALESRVTSIASLNRKSHCAFWDDLKELRSDYEASDAKARECVAELALIAARHDRDLDVIRRAIATNNATLRAVHKASDANLVRLAKSADALGDAFDEFALADRNRRERQADLFRFAAAEVNGKDLSVTFTMLADDTFDPEVDGDADADDDTDTDTDEETGHAIG